MKGTMTKRWATALASVAALTACESLLTVQDPQRYTTEDVNNALPATANGVEGNLHVAVDDFVTFQSLLSDVYQHTGTWSNYDEVDHGRFQYGTSGLDGAHNTWLRVQWAAMDAERRFGEILGEAEAANSELTAQVRMSGAFAALYMGMAFCESVGEPSGPAITDMQSLQLAADRFGAAMQTAQAAGRSDYVRASQAGRAQARALLGDWAGAASDAAAVGSGFSYDARFNDVRTNSVVTLTTKTFNEAAGLMYTLWDRIEQSDKAGYMRDAWSDEPDKRMPVFFDGEVATDNETPHYSQWKYNSRPDDIPMVHSDLMRLIEAEAMLNNSNDYAGATGVLNELRMAVELPPLETPTDAQTMLDYLLSERLAELFMEGQRAVDLHRFELTRAVFDPLDDNERPGAGRPTKFTMSDSEALFNDSIENDLTKRCAPKS